jgi:hypothetical protein
MIPPELESLFEEIGAPVIFGIDDEYPHATPMNWLWLNRENLFWFNPAGGTKKIKLLKRNKYVCFGTADEMKEGKKGFIVWGEVVKYEYGFWALGRNARIKKRMLVEKSGLRFNAGLFKFWSIYAKHPDIHYSTLPWEAAFVRVKPTRIVYWLDDGIEKELTLE